jgi:hypothetical protein
MGDELSVVILRRLTGSAARCKGEPAFGSGGLSLYGDAGGPDQYNPPVPTPTARWAAGEASACGISASAGGA